MATINVRESLEVVIGGKAIRRGTRSRPYTITAASGLHWGRTFVVADDETVLIFDAGNDTWTPDPDGPELNDEGNLEDPVLVRIEWTDGPVELAWGRDETIADSDTSSFISNDAVGGFMYLWGSGQYPHDGLSCGDRNSVVTGAGDTGIGRVYLTNTSGGSITVEVDAFK